MSKHQHLATTDTSSASLEFSESTSSVDPYSLDYDSEAETDRWYEEQAREARQVREDAREAIWYAEQIYGDPVTEEVRAAAIEDLIAAHYEAQSAADDADITFSDYGALRTLIAALPKSPTIALVAMSLSARPGQQGRRSPRTRRSTRIRRARAPGTSEDPDLPLDHFVPSRGVPGSRGCS